MLQFEYLNEQKMSSQNTFLKHLEKFINNIYDPIPISVETRNPNYLNKNYFQGLKDLGLSNVFLHGYYMPSIWETYDNISEYLISPVVIRLHGPDR